MIAAAPPPAITCDVDGKVYSCIVRRGKVRTFFWCGQEVDEFTYYRNLANLARAGFKGQCPKET